MINIYYQDTYEDGYRACDLFETIYQLKLLDENKAVIKRLTKEFEKRFKDVEINNRGEKIIMTHHNYWNSTQIVYKFTGLVEVGRKCLIFSPFKWKTEEKKEEKVKYEHPDKHRYAKQEQVEDETYKEEKKEVTKPKKKSKKKHKKLYRDVQNELMLDFNVMPIFHRTLIYAKNGCKVRKYNVVKEKELLVAMDKARKIFSEDLPDTLMKELIPPFIKSVANQQGWKTFYANYYKGMTYGDLEEQMIRQICGIFGGELHLAKYYERWSSPTDENNKKIPFEGKIYMVKLKNTKNLEFSSKWNRWHANHSEYTHLKFNTLRQFLKEVKKEMTKDYKVKGKVVLKQLGFEM